jgi:hypothetical protein
MAKNETMPARQSIQSKHCSPYELGVSLFGESSDARAFTVGYNTPVTIAAFVSGRREGIIGRIGTKLAIDTFCEAAMRIAGGSRRFARDFAGQLVRVLMKEANSRVYEYAAKMLSGGKLGVDTVVAAFDGTSLAVCRAGPYDGFLRRGGAFVPLFDRAGAMNSSGFLGDEQHVTVDFFSVPGQPGDELVLGTIDCEAAEVSFLKAAGAAAEGERLVPEKLCRTIAEEARRPGDGFVFCLRVDVPAITLAQVAHE